MEVIFDNIPPTELAFIRHKMKLMLTIATIRDNWKNKLSRLDNDHFVTQCSETRQASFNALTSSLRLFIFNVS